MKPEKLKLPKINEGLIKKVLAHIEKYPRAYNQNTISDLADKAKETPCGTIACFGGWAKLLTLPKKDRFDFVKHNGDVDLNEAAVLLGLTQEEGQYLFDPAFSDKTPGSAQKNSQIIKKRLDHIRTSREMVKKLEEVTGPVFEYFVTLKENKDIAEDAEDW